MGGCLGAVVAVLTVIGQYVTLCVALCSVVNAQLVQTNIWNAVRHYGRRSHPCQCISAMPQQILYAGLGSLSMCHACAFGVLRCAAHFHAWPLVCSGSLHSCF